MRAGPQLGVAKATRAPPCTLPILGRRFFYALLIAFPYYYKFYCVFKIFYFIYIKGVKNEKTAICCVSS